MENYLFMLLGIVIGYLLAVGLMGSARSDLEAELAKYKPRRGARGRFVKKGK